MLLYRARSLGSAAFCTCCKERSLQQRAQHRLLSCNPSAQQLLQCSGRLNSSIILLQGYPKGSLKAEYMISMHSYEHDAAVQCRPKHILESWLRACHKLHQLTWLILLLLMMMMLLLLMASVAAPAASAHGRKI